MPKIAFKMKNIIFEDKISVDRLLLDVENPRLPRVAQNQRDAISLMCRTRGKEILNLAEHITNNAFDPATLMMVMPVGEDHLEYITLDGNRRITALKILETPEVLTDEFSSSELRRIKKLSIKYARSPIEIIKCVVYPNRKTADPWITLKHRGQNEGVGLVSWSGQVSAEYDRRRGKVSSSLQLLKFAADHIKLDPAVKERIDLGRFPVTTLDRLINTKYVYEKLGFKKDKGVLYTSHAASDLTGPLKRVIDDIGLSRVTVTDLKGQSQRIDYINEVYKKISHVEPSKDMKQVPLEEVGDKPQPKADTAKGDSKPDSGATGKRGGTKGVKPRKTLIPKKCKLSIPQARLNDISIDLKNISCDDYPNSIAVMFRVFMELSLDHFLEHELKWEEQKIINTFLQKKMQATVTYFKNNDLLSKNKLAGMAEASKTNSILAPTYKSLHGFVHNYHVSPISSELKTLWDNVEPFFVKLWS